MLAATKDFWKKYWALGILLAMLVFVLAAQIIPEVYAKPYNQEMLQSEVSQFFQGLQKTGLSYMKEAYKLCIPLFDPSKAKDSNDVVIKGYSVISDFIRGIGFGMVIVYFLLAIIKESLRGEDFGMEAWTRLLVQLGLALTVIIFLPDILSALFSFGSTVIDTISNALQVDESLDTTALQDKVLNNLGKENNILGFNSKLKDVMDNKSSDFFDVQSMGSMMSTVYPIVTLLPVLACMYLIYAAIFECKLRELFAPIAVASITYEGARSAGMRYIKKYLAIFVKIGIYFVIAAIGHMVSMYFFNMLLDAKCAPSYIPIYMVLGLMGNVVAALTMMQMGGMADEIVGV